MLQCFASKQILLHWWLAPLRQIETKMWNWNLKHNIWIYSEIQRKIWNWRKSWGAMAVSSHLHMSQLNPSPMFEVARWWYITNFTQTGSASHDYPHPLKWRFLWFSAAFNSSLNKMKCCMNDPMCSVEPLLWPALPEIASWGIFSSERHGLGIVTSYTCIIGWIVTFHMHKVISYQMDAAMSLSYWA